MRDLIGVRPLGVILTVALLAGVAAAQQPFQIGRGVGEEQVTVDADSISYDQDGSQLRAEGDVVISSGWSILAADSISVRRASGEADAVGDVLLEDPEARIKAERAWIELDDETGFLVDGEVHLRRNRFLLSGGRLEKGLGQSYRLWDGEFTTCLCGEGAPDWSIAGDEIDVGLGGWGEVRGGTFKVKDIPVLYLPYALFPVQRDRQSGFLFPRFGISSRRGFQYVQPYYWAIDKSSDLTVSLDVETNARVGILGDYRYLLGPDAGGRLSASYFSEFDPAEQERRGIEEDPEVQDPSIPKNRWSVIGYHQQTGPYESRIYARPFYVSDNLFLRDMNTLSYVPAQNLLLTTIRYTTSDAGIVKVGSWGQFKAQATWYQDLYQKQSRQPQPLPDITLQLRKRFFQLVTARLNTQAVYYYRAPLASGPRLDIAPDVSIPYRFGEYGFGTARLTLRETLYYLVNDEIPFGFEQEDGTLQTRTVDRFQHREILQGHVSFQSEVSRVYRFEDAGELRKLKHTIEPYVNYRYIPAVNQDDLPIWGTHNGVFVDRINRRNLVTYGILTRFLGKFGGGEEEYAGPEEDPAYAESIIGEDPYGPMIPPLLSGSRPAQIRELGRIAIQQSYSLGDQINSSTEDLRRRSYFSTVGLYGRITPVGWAGLTSRAEYSTLDNKFIFANVGANIFDPRPIEGEGDLFQPNLRPAHSASVYYQFNTRGAVENLNLATTLRITNYLAVSYLGRFDGESGRFLENWAGFRVISGCDCWVFDAALVDRLNPDEIEFRFRFSLVGLGTFGQSPFAEFNNAFPTPTANGPDFGAVY